jgi:outer membrane receptor protein involved in Fe transport
VGDDIPGSVSAVISGGATLDSLRDVCGSIRLRYFGPRPLVENNSVRSKATKLVNVEADYKIAKHMKIGLDVFNAFNAQDSDIDYYYASRLQGEPAGGVNDIHLHPTLPRTARVNLIVGF